MIDYQTPINKGLSVIDASYKDALMSLGNNPASDISSTVFDKIAEFDYVGLISILKILAISVSAIILLFLIVVIYKANRFGKEGEKIKEIPEPASGGMLVGRWTEIMNHMQSERETEWKLAIIEADNLVNDILAKAGFPGSTMGERLTGMRHEQLLALPGVWKAHLLRNRIVHEIDYSPRYQEIHEALKYYRAALEELGIM